MNSKNSKNVSRCSENNENKEDEDTLCGVGKCKPRWIQRFANSKLYLINYCILGILEGACFSSYMGTLSTLEKRYSFDNKISGFILIADNLCPIILSILFGQLSGRIHRPRWISYGIMVMALSCFISSLPYFIYGPALHLITKDPKSLVKPKYEYCNPEENKYCLEDELSPTVPAITMIFIGSVLLGVASVAYYVIGMPFLDDNVKKSDSPIYLAFMGCLSVFGPSFGFMVSSFSLQFYEDPFFDPGFDQSDPRWIGAWWLSFVILGVLSIIFSIPIFFCPRRLPTAPIRSTHIQEQNSGLPKIKDIPKSLLRLIKNPMFMCIAVVGILHANGETGYFISMPKYIENQYRQSASSANFFTGSAPLIAVMFGILGGGIIIGKLRPKPRYLTAYMVFIDFIGVIGLLASMFLGCPQIEITGSTFVENELNLYNECNSGCGCTKRIFEPVCGLDEKSLYFSPCFAGCTGMNDSSGKTIFTNCSCVYNETGSTFTTDTIEGYCPMDCNMFTPYIVILSVTKFIGSTTGIGSMLILLRCVNPEDKSLALGTIESLLAILAFIPSPLMFGALVDSVCIVWEEHCGKTGNCWLYNTDTFRYSVHILGIALILAGNIFYIGIFYLSKRLKNFYEDVPLEVTHMEEINALPPVNDAETPKNT